MFYTLSEYISYLATIFRAKQELQRWKGRNRKLKLDGVKREPRQPLLRFYHNKAIPAYLLQQRDNTGRWI